MKLYLKLFAAFIMFTSIAEGQVFRYRLGLNSGIFITEAGKPEVEPDGKISYPGSEDFKPSLKSGIELEIIRPLARDFEIGLQLGYMNLAGHTPTAPLYNFFLTRHNPLPDAYKYPKEDLIYDTRLLNILGTARWYFLPYNKELNFFMKFFGGVTFTGTDFTFADRYYRVFHKVGVLYARGTENSDYPKMAAVTGGTGLGATYRISDKLDVYADLSASGIYSDIVNGVPNYDYIIRDGKSSSQRTNTLSIISHGSLGIIYSAIPDRRMSKSNVTRTHHINRNMFSKKSNSRYKKKR
jgi:hypothetical protein